MTSAHIKLALRPYQDEGLNGIRSQLRAGKRAALFVLPTGGGKCLGRGTPVLMYDGSVVPVEDVGVGDLVMGPDSKPRRVESIARGREALYRVIPTKGDPYVVNESHILSLKRTASKSDPIYPSQRGGSIVNISVREYLEKSKSWRHIHKGWRAAVDFQAHAEPALIPPYMLGVWLGDGASRHFSVTTEDPEIAQEVVAYADSERMRCRAEKNSIASVNIHLVAPIGVVYGKRGGPTGTALRYYDLVRNKHIPHRYLTGSREERLDLLAGLIDTDGSYSGKGFDLVFKSKRLADDAAFVARSLGMAAYISQCKKTCTNNGVEGTYYRISVSGHCDQVPCRVERKRAAPRLQKKDVQVTGITLEAIGDGDYFGFELSGPDRLFLLGDFTVTHNTVTYAAMAQGAALKGNRILILEHRKELIRQASLALGGLGVRHQVIAPADKVADIRRAHVAKLGWPMIENTAHVAVASVQTLGRRMQWLEEYAPQIIVIDEAHHAVAGTWKRIIEACPNAILVGVTATPCRADGVGLIDVFDAMVLGPSMRELIQMGYLLPARVYSVPLSEDLSNVAHKGGDIDPSAAAALLDKPSITGSAVDHYSQLAPGRPAIAFCSSVRHAENVAADFRAAGFRFEVVTGDMDDNERDRRIMGLADGSLHGICTVDVVSEGTDIPVAEVAILLRPTESESLYLQQVGRVLRTVFADGFDLSTEDGRHDAIGASGKPWGLVLDHVGNVLRHGMPHADRDWTLEGRKRGAKKQEEEEKGEKVLQCPKCYGVEAPRQVCGCLKPDGTICNHVFEVQSRKVQQREGQLQEIVDDTIAPRIQTGKARDMDGLKAMGISEGRAQHILEARAEKERLQNELRDLLSQWSRTTGRGVRDGWGFSMADVRDMKPKALKANIEQVGQALFMGEADNDNEQDQGVMYGNA